MTVTSELGDVQDWLTAFKDDPSELAAIKQIVATHLTGLKTGGAPRAAQVECEAALRRCERALGLALRRGQAEGQIETQEDARRRAFLVREVKYGRRPESVLENPKPRVLDFATESETSNSKGDIFTLVDGVTDEQFEKALALALDEGNVSRRGVIRALSGLVAPKASVKSKADLISDLAAQGWSSRQMADEVGVSDERVREIAREFHIPIQADRSVYRTRQHDSNRIMRETVSALEGIAMGVELIDTDALDLDEVKDWHDSLGRSIAALNRLRKQIGRI